MKSTRPSPPWKPLLLALSLTLPVSAQAPATPPAKPAEEAADAEFDDGDWPQVYETSNGFEIAIHQPQIHDWPDYRRLTMRAAIVIRPKDGGEESIEYGAITVESDTTVDKEERVVFFGDREVKELNFPNAPETQEADFRKAVLGVLNPTRPLSINLDRVLANAERNQRQLDPEGISMAPPPIYFSSEPSILVMFMGPPQFEQIKGNSLFFGVNTNWDLILDPSTTTYFLLNGDSWLSSKDVEKGPWTATTKVPADLAKLPASEDWKEIKAALPAKKGAAAPKVVVTKQPAELIITDGQPVISSIKGTKILYVANTSSDVFMVDAAYHLLTSGRWFRAKALEGPWESAVDDLSPEFAKIPEDHEKAYVLASVPGTDDAEEAIIMAQVPQIAQVNRSEAELEVKYEGEPEFVAIKDTTVKYAINTPEDVFQVDPKYYCCSKGVWFVSASPQGPWIVCDSVPDAIYTIPASSPKHNVTYVNVYESSPEYVNVGYTSGYSGAYVARNLLVFGAGLWFASEIYDDHHHHYGWHRHPSYYSYGCGARYNWHNGGYYRHGHGHYGPYGGAGHGAVYNPWTGGYARGGHLYGPRGSAYGRSAYNPWTNTSGARVGASTPYGKWGKSAVRRNDEWARTGYTQGRRGTVSGFETSKGAGGIKVNRKYGSDSFALKNKNNDLYVGKDGKIVKRDNNGDWSSMNKGKWNDMNRPNRADGNRRPVTRQDRPGTRPSTRPSTRPGGGTRPSTRPSTPGRPSTQPVKPSRPTTRPSTPSRPSTQPVKPSRPTTRPTTPSRPTTRPSTRQRSSSGQLSRDYQARQRGSSRTRQSRSSRSSSRSSRSRSSGGRSRGRR